MDQLRLFFGEVLPRWWSPQGLLEVTPPLEWAFRWVYVGLLIALFLVSLVTAFLKIRPSLKSRIQSLCWTNIILGVILYFSRDQRIPYIGMDGIRFLQELVLIFWINGIVRFAKTSLQDELLQEKIAARKSKYLPNRIA